MDHLIEPHHPGCTYGMAGLDRFEKPQDAVFAHKHVNFGASRGRLATVKKGHRFGCIVKVKQECAAAKP